MGVGFPVRLPGSLSVLRRSGRPCEAGASKSGGRGEGWRGFRHSLPPWCADPPYLRSRWLLGDIHQPPRRSPADSGSLRRCEYSPQPGYGCVLRLAALPVRSAHFHSMGAEGGGQVQGGGAPPWKAAVPLPTAKGAPGAPTTRWAPPVHPTTGRTAGGPARTGAPEPGPRQRGPTDRNGQKSIENG